MDASAGLTSECSLRLGAALNKSTFWIFSERGKSPERTVQQNKKGQTNTVTVVVFFVVKLIESDGRGLTSSPNRGPEVKLALGQAFLDAEILY